MIVVILSEAFEQGSHFDDDLGTLSALPSIDPTFEPSLSILSPTAISTTAPTESTEKPTTKPTEKPTTVAAVCAKAGEQCPATLYDT